MEKSSRGKAKYEERKSREEDQNDDSQDQDDSSDQDNEQMAPSPEEEFFQNNERYQFGDPPLNRYDDSRSQSESLSHNVYQ